METPIVPSKVCKCTVPPDHLRSEISLHTCNIPNLMSYIQGSSYAVLKSMEKTLSFFRLEILTSILIIFYSRLV